jgi:hypothetical protein
MSAPPALIIISLIEILERRTYKRGGFEEKSARTISNLLFPRFVGTLEVFFKIISQDCCGANGIVRILLI